MQRILSSIASAVLFTASLSQARNNHVASDPRAALRQIEADASGAAVVADELDQPNHNFLSKATDMEFLMQIGDDINRMGKEIQRLESEQAVLTPWERDALTKAVPLLRDAAENTDHAVNLLKGTITSVWAAKVYRSDTEKIEKDFAQTAKLLRNYLKLEDATGKEERLRQSLGLEGGS